MSVGVRRPVFMKTNYNLRAIAAQAIAQVLDKGLSLSAVLPEMQKGVNDKDKALLQELCFGTLRVLPLLSWYLNQLMKKELTGKQRSLHYLLLIGLYQIIYTRIPPHAAVAETVSGAVALKRPQLKGLLNGVLRQFQRQQQELETQVQKQNCRFLHPSWLLRRLKLAYPQSWQDIVEANNQKPPMWLRVNRRYHSRDQYLVLLAEKGIDAFADSHRPDAVRLASPQQVSALPGFDDGWVTVQDLSAQESVEYLQPQNGELILDLCAAPGGKTTHILEAAPEANVIAVDIDQLRADRIQQNLIRLKQSAEVIVGDGRDPQSWCKGRLFDRILLDAPCSATGVIRRHPDIKWLRRDEDIEELVQLQRQILLAIWPCLKEGGTLIYATCSVLPEENEMQIRHFLADRSDAKVIDLTEHRTMSDSQPTGKQNLPSTFGGDGFFYAKLIKLRP
jgi:16S rRNA (cytosine967-C5)-methyltransferase